MITMTSHNQKQRRLRYETISALHSNDSASCDRVGRVIRRICLCCDLPGAKVCRHHGKAGNCERKRTKPGPATTVHCVVGVKTNLWMIEGDTGQLIVGARETCWFTGTNIIEFAKITTAVTNNSGDQSDAPPVGTHWSYIWNSKDGNPAHRVHQADAMSLRERVCWLAFCSGSFLKTPGRHLNPASDLWKEWVDEPEGGFRDETTTFPDSLGLPKEVRILTAENQTMLHYRVEQEAEFKGWTLPQSFSVIEYAPMRAGHGWELYYMLKATVMDIEEAEAPVIPKEVFDHVRTLD